MASVRARDLRRWLKDAVGETLGVDPASVDVTAPLTSLGLSSLEGITLARRLGEWLGHAVPATIVWDFPTIEQIVQIVAATRDDDLPHTDSSPAPASEPTASLEVVACIGSSCRFPGAPSQEAFWALLERGGDGVSEVPPDRWDVDAFYSDDPQRPGTIASRRGGFLDDIDRFDAGFFGLTPREACALDPRQRLALEAAWDALEDAGIRPRTLAGTRTGVFMATLSGNFGATLFTHYLRAVDAYAGSGSGNSVVANRISHVLDLHGPSVAIDTACSGSLVAVHLACESLRRGECDTAIVGGVNVILRPGDSVFFSKTGALAPDGRCKPFDRAANGIVRSEGVGVVVLRRLSDALVRGDRVLALIRGTAVNHGGATNGIMAPSSRAQEQVLRQACEAAALDPAALQYVEAHGTGTPIGDPIEAAALGRVFGQAPGREAPLALGSVKGNIGHTEAAAGLAGLIKVVLSIQRQALLGSAGFEQPNPLIDFAGLGLKVIDERAPWPRADRPRIAGVSAFGFSGTNAHVIVSEPPAPSRGEPSDAEQPRGPHLLLISGRSRAQLDAHVEAFSRFLGEWSGPLAAVATASALHREHHPWRLAALADTPSDARRSLDAFAAGELGVGCAHVERPLHEPKLAFVFSGQGSRWLGMGRDLIEREPLVRRVIRQCEQIIAALGGPALSLVDGARSQPDSVRDQLEIFAIQVAIAALLRQRGVVPDAVVGQSLGEVAAAHVAGALSLEDALRVVVERSRCMAEIAGAGATAVIGLGADELRRRIAEQPELDFAGASSPTLSTVSGTPAAVDRWVTACEREGVFARRIPDVDVAFHGAQIDPLLEPLSAALAELRPRPTRIPLYSTVTGAVVDGRVLDGGYWARNLREPFVLPQAIAAMHADDLELFVEIAPHPLLQQPLRACVGPRKAAPPVLATLEREADGHRCMQATLAWLHAWGFEIDWAARYPEPAVEVPLPRTVWQRERHWFDQLPHAQVPSGFDWATKRPWVGAIGAGDHPLLGTALELAGRAGERAWTRALSHDAPAWLGDHVVGGQILLPAAAMLAMAVSAALELIDAEAVEVGELAIERPLVVPTDATITTQTRARERGDGRWSWALYARESGGWVRHASATLGPARPVQELGPRPDQARDACSSKPVALAEHFARMAADGLDYGPSFRTLRTLELAHGELRATLELASEARSDLDAYPLHPTLIDGAIQATRQLGRAGAGATDEGDPARLPVGFERVSCRRSSVRPPAAARCSIVAEPGGAAGVLRAGLVLESEGGEPVLAIEGLELRAITGVRSRTPAELGFALRWVEQPLASRWTGRDGPSGPNFQTQLDGRIAGWSEELDVEHHSEQWPTLEALATAYVVAALRELGWRPAEGEVVELEPLAAALGVVTSQRRLLRRVLQILAEDEITAALDGRADAWVIRRELPDPDPQPLIARMQARFPAAVAELGLIRRLGPALPGVLRGELDVLTRLFDDRGEALLRALYRDAPIMQVYNRIVAEVVAAMLREPERGPLRVLEVGAGTGATTSHVLGRLVADDDESDARFTYAVSDRSARLAERAAVEFAGDPRVRTATLDLERPANEQGFAAGSADVLVAANVLHATRDLGASLAHARALLAPGGLLVLLESTGPQRWLDVIVGGTEGWWRFADQRRDHPLLDAASWVEQLTAAGFEAVERYVDAGPAPRQAVIVGRAPALAPTPRRWLVLGDRRGVAAQLEQMLGERGELDVAHRERPPSPAELQALVGTGDLTIVHTRALELPGELAQVESAELDRVELELEQLRDLARAIAAASGGPKLELWVATAGVHAVADEPRPVAALRGPIWGLVRSLFLEHEDVAGALVDLDPHWAPELAAARLLAEIAEAHDEDQIAWRGSSRYVARVVRARSLERRRSSAVRADATYLITGGTRGIGLATARWLVGRGARRLALMARTPLPPRRRWDEPSIDGELADRIAGVRELEAAGAAVRVLTADLGDERAVAAGLDRLDDEGWPAIRGVVHSAGSIDDHLLVNLERPALQRVLRPKLRGPWLLDRRFGASLDFFVMFSSATSLIGGTLGQANYAAGNAFLDALARDRVSRGLAATAINWGIWGGAGIIDRSDLQAQLERTGLRPIVEAEGLAALEHALASGVAQLGVIAVDWEVWGRALPGLAAKPYYSLVDRPSSADSRRSSSASSASEPEPLAVVLRGLTGAERRARIRELVTALVAEVTMQPQATIGRATPLHALGLDSIMAVELKHRLDGRFGGSISVVELLRSASVESLAEAVAAGLDAGFDAGFDVIGREPDRSAASGPSPRAATGVRRASSVQLAFWSLQQRSPASPVYALPILVELGRRLDAGSFATVVAKLIERHAILRTALEVVDGRLVQRVLDLSPPATVGVVDLRGLAPDVAEATLEREARRWARLVFDLSAPPLIRCTLFQTPERSVCLFNLHHAAVDGWSASVIVREFEALYTAEETGAPAPLSTPSLAYADYVEWQYERLERGEFDAQLDYWRAALANPPAPLLVPIAPAAERGFPGRQQRVEIEAEVVRGLDLLRQTTGATMFMVLLAGLSALLHRLHGRERLTVGAARSNRDRSELRDVLGCFVNMLAVRVDVDPQASFRGLVEVVRDAAIEAFAHCDLPFEHALRAAGTPAPFEVVFVFKTTPTWLPTVVTRVEQLDIGVSKYPLSLDLTRSGDAIEGFFEYDSDRFTTEEAAALARLLGAVLRAAVAGSERPLTAILDAAARDPLYAPHDHDQESIHDDAAERFGF